MMITMRAAYTLSLTSVVPLLFSWREQTSSSRSTDATAAAGGTAANQLEAVRPRRREIASAADEFGRPAGYPRPPPSSESHTRMTEAQHGLRTLVHALLCRTDGPCARPDCTGDVHAMKLLLKKMADHAATCM